MAIQTYTTEQVAEIFHMKENSIRSRLCLDGDFYGVKPIKLPTGRLLWPAKEIDSILGLESD